MEAKNSDLTLDRLKEVLSYDPETGDFTWLVTRGRNAPAGTVASQSVNSQGYRHIHVDMKGYKAHRLAWFYIYGVWPKLSLDHINGVKHDNRITNLREATRQQNRLNSAKWRTSHKKSKYPGVAYFNYNRYEGWRAKFGKKDLGLFKVEEDAYAAYLAELQKVNAEFDLALNPSHGVLE